MKENVYKKSAGSIMMPMSGYTKLFNSILASTIWREDDKTRIVWITLLAMANRDGIAEGSVPGLADFAHVSIEDCEAALAKLKAPDKYSRSKDNDGRRIADVDGGWQILNHGKYRAKMSYDERKVYFAEKQREYRARKKSESRVENVKDSEGQVKEVTHTKAKAEAKADTYPRDLDLQVAELKKLYGSLFPAVERLDDFDAAFRKIILKSRDFPALKAALPVVTEHMLRMGWAETISPAAVLDPLWFWAEYETACADAVGEGPSRPKRKK